MGGVDWTIRMKPDEVLDRLNTIEGHIRGIKRMVEEDKYCVDIIHQIQAVQSALNKVNLIILDNHLNSCVITAIRGEDIKDRERVLNEITGIFSKSIKQTY
jgi:DNA-binding FrmR family transcriptional regulator